MLIPKIVFKYSWIYDQNWKRWIKNYGFRSGKYPSTLQVLNYIKRLEKGWRKIHRSVLTEMSTIVGLGWKSKTIDCYVVGNCIPFSEPLTMCIYDKLDASIDSLTHELIHRLFTDGKNLEESTRSWNYIFRKYRKEPHTTKIHIPLHAIHEHIYMTFFGEKRLKRDIKWISYLPDYRRSWKIVQEEGYQNIIKEFRSRI